jgi:hypothetical protein
MSPEAERSTADLAPSAAGSMPDSAVLERSRPVSPSETTIDLEEILEAAGIAPGGTTADVEDRSGPAEAGDTDPAGHSATEPAEGPDADPSDGLHIDPSEDTVDIDEALAAEGTSVAELTAAGLDAWPGASLAHPEEGVAKQADGPYGAVDPAPAYPPPAAAAAFRAPSDSVAIDGPAYLLPSAPGPTAAAPRPRRRAVLPFALAAVLLVLAVAGVFAVLMPRARDAAAAAPVPTPAAAPLVMPPLPAASADGATTDSATEPAPSDPRLAFSDLGLRTLAEPYLLGADPVCAPSALAADEQERVVCDLGNGWVGLFVRVTDADALYALRDGFERGTGALPGTTTATNWDFVAGGVKDGLEISDPNPGQGVRVRYTDERGTPRLYFDQEATLALSFLANVDPARDGEALLAYWADPLG